MRKLIFVIGIIVCVCLISVATVKRPYVVESFDIFQQVGNWFDQTTSTIGKTIDDGVNVLATLPQRVDGIVQTMGSLGRIMKQLTDAEVIGIVTKNIGPLINTIKELMNKMKDIMYIMKLLIARMKNCSYFSRRMEERYLPIYERNYAQLQEINHLMVFCINPMNMMRMDYSVKCFSRYPMLLYQLMMNSMSNIKLMLDLMKMIKDSPELYPQNSKLNQENKFGNTRQDCDAQYAVLAQQEKILYIRQAKINNSFQQNPMMQKSEPLSKEEFDKLQEENKQKRLMLQKERLILEKQWNEYVEKCNQCFNIKSFVKLQFTELFNLEKLLTDINQIFTNMAPILNLLVKESFITEIQVLTENLMKIVL